jgi:hypothetical protein
VVTGSQSDDAAIGMTALKGLDGLHGHANPLERTGRVVDLCGRVVAVGAT